MNELLNRHPKAAASMAVIALIGAVAFMFYSQATKNRRPKGDLWYYNTETRELFPESDLSVPPIDTVSGPNTGVRAYVYSCGDCSDPDQRYVAYLEYLVPRAKKAVEGQVAEFGDQVGIGMAMEKFESGIMVRAVDGTDWVPQLSPRGQQIIEEGRLSGGCEHPRPCVP